MFAPTFNLPPVPHINHIFLANMALSSVDLSGNNTNGREHSIPVLPKNCELSYLDEGAANIVYRVSVRPSTPEPSSIETYEDGTPPPSELEFQEESISHVLESK